jgi:asparagine synthase (glutamine-hydrolysing)
MLKALKYFPNMRGSERTLERVIQSVRAMGIPVHPKFSGILAYGNSIAGAYLLQRGIFLPHQLDMHRYDLRDIQRGLDELQPIEMIEREIRPKLQYTFSNVSTLESSFYMRNQLLRDVDWAGMAHSIEVRTPLVDSKVLTELAPYLARKRPPNGKALLARSPVIPLPDVIINRGKTGFGIPLSNWCTDELNVSVLVPNYDGGRLWSRVWLNKISDLFEGEKRSLAASDIPPSAEATPSGAALDKRTRPLVTNTTDDPIVKLAPSGPD